MDEQTAADKKINAFLKKLYRECDAHLSENNAAFVRDFEENWEYLAGLWEGWFSEENPDMEEAEQKRAVADESSQEIRAGVSFADEKYLVVAVSCYEYWFPGAHGMYWDDYYVFDRRTGERLTLLDFVDNTAEGVGIHFDVYEPSSYAGGAQDIIIPYEEFRIKEGMML